MVCSDTTCTLSKKFLAHVFRSEYDTDAKTILCAIGKVFQIIRGTVLDHALHYFRSYAAHTAIVSYITFTCVTATYLKVKYLSATAQGFDRTHWFV